MRKRGPQPVDLVLLNFWEFEFYKVFHLLREGTPFPAKYSSPISGLSVQEIRVFLKRLKDMDAMQYWLTSRQVAVRLGKTVNLKKPPGLSDLYWAERQQNQEIFWLERAANPPKAEAQRRRRKIWNDIVRATTYAALRKACGRWTRLPDVISSGLICFPTHVIDHAAQFLMMKRNKRFPHSQYGDDARIEYLARGMAGAIVGVSPMTGIERLRNMKHDARGPLWDKAGNYCCCWRCGLMQHQEDSKLSRTWYENGLKLFMEVARTTKIPTEWKLRQKQM